MRRAVAAALIAVFGAIGVTVASAGGRTAHDRWTRRFVTVTIPKCAEGERFLRGYGEFENGHWEHYRCVHRGNR